LKNDSIRVKSCPRTDSIAEFNPAISAGVLFAGIQFKGKLIPPSACSASRKKMFVSPPENF
jgi:hypothetical protein